MNILTDEEIKAIDPDGLAEGFARAIESAVLKKLKAQEPFAYFSINDYGAWEETSDPTAFALYEHPLPPDDVVRDAERYRWLIDNSYDRDGFLQFQVWKHSWEPHSQTGIPIEWKCRVRGPTIDAAIDAAILLDKKHGME